MSVCIFSTGPDRYRSFGSCYLDVWKYYGPLREDGGDTRRLQVNAGDEHVTLSRDEAVRLALVILATFPPEGVEL